MQRIGSRQGSKSQLHYMQSMGTLGLAEETDRGQTIQDHADYHLESD